MEDKPFLFEWESALTMPNRVNQVRYTLVYAKDADEAFKKINEAMNKTQISWNIRLATIV